MPDLIRHPVVFWIADCAAMTSFGYLSTGAISTGNSCILSRVRYRGPCTSQTRNPKDAPRTPQLAPRITNPVSRNPHREPRTSFPRNTHLVPRNPQPVLHSLPHRPNNKKGRKDPPFSPVTSTVRHRRLYPRAETARLNGRNIFRKAAWRVIPRLGTDATACS